MKKKLKIIKILLSLIILVSVGFGVYYTLNVARDDYRVKDDSYSSKVLPKEFDGFKVGYLSDLNLSDGNDLKRLKKIVKSLNNKKVDLVIFGGDIFNSTAFENEQIIQILKSIETNYGKFGVLGEKDLIDSATTQSILTESGFEVLHNEYRKIYYNNSSISLFGLENNGDVASLINDTNKDSYKLVTIHQPDYFSEVSKSDIQLQLSGHTLGGYIKLPIIGGIVTKDNGSKYVSGSHSKNNSKLLISNGVGYESSQDYRLFTFNEINIITLQSE